jgi:hypothetical protein
MYIGKISVKLLKYNYAFVSSVEKVTIFIKVNNRRCYSYRLRRERCSA